MDYQIASTDLCPCFCRKEVNMAGKKVQISHRNSKTGRFTTEAKAKKSPATHERERIKKGKK